MFHVLSFMKLIDGKKIAERIKDEIVQEVVKMKGARPNLAIILVGEREDSKIYVSLKEKQAKAVGIDTHLYRCNYDIAEAELISLIDYLNADELIDGILLQLPLPEGLDADKAVERILPAKDVDGFQPENLKKLLSGCDYEIEPPLIAVISEILKEINFELKDKAVTALVNSAVLGRVIKHVLECRGARVAIAHENDPELKQKAERADVLITALGKPKFIKQEMIKKGAVVIDIGITRLPDGTVAGDVDQLEAEKRAAWLTPVPGGVGPITIAMALKNTLRLYGRKRTTQTKPE